jgi:hypothetical protein
VYAAVNDAGLRTHRTNDRIGIDVNVDVPAAAANEHAYPLIDGLIQSILLHKSMQVLMKARILILLRNLLEMDETS